jgi:hypothetical protein
VIDPELLDAAMKAGPYQTKKEAVEAGLKLLARQAAYREILKWKGKLKWEGDESIDWTQPRADDEAAELESVTVPVAPVAETLAVQEPAGAYGAKDASKAGRRARR